MAKLSLKEDFNGVWPSGPFSLYPQKRSIALFRSKDNTIQIIDDLTIEEHGELAMEKMEAQRSTKERKKVNASFADMAKGLAKTAGQAMMHGKVSEEIRNERYDTCKNCPFFIEDSKRCSECGCFMEAKTWVGGDPNMLCPKQKWSR